MEPLIQYAAPADGTSIAFCVAGHGPAVVHMPPMPWSHVSLEWEIPEARSWYERLASAFTLVRYDARGSGLSERAVTDFSLDAHVADLLAVVDRAGLDSFALVAPFHAGPAAIAFAARHPERLTHLVLWHSYARGRDFFVESAEQRALAGLLDVSWDMYTETLAHSALGWSEGMPAHSFASMMRQASTPQLARAMFDALEKADVTDLLPQIHTPALVLMRREAGALLQSLSRRMAARLPDARLVVVDGSSGAPYLGDAEGVARAVTEFTGHQIPSAQPRQDATAALPGAGAVRTILFTDIEGSTALTERLGDVTARALLREYERLTRDALKAHGGAEVKSMGDGFMASFPSASGALECAMAMQRAFAARNAADSEPIRIRIGLNAGEPIAEEEDLFGTAVIMAARIAAQAQGGEILCSNVVRELTAGKGFLFHDRGSAALRGFEDPVRLYEVRWRE